jgi:hypothetical protein
MLLWIVALAWLIQVPSTALITNRLRYSSKQSESVTMSHISLRKDSLFTNDLQPPQYSTDELKTALNSLLEGSTKPSHDARHIFGYGEVDHVLSTLQIITATVLLDYQSRMVSLRIVTLFLIRFTTALTFLFKFTTFNDKYQ